MKIAVGAEVRVHYHPPGLRQSFAEGTVSQAEMITLRGRGILIDTAREVILGRERAVKSGVRTTSFTPIRANFQVASKCYPKPTGELGPGPTTSSPPKRTRTSPQKKP